MMKFFVLNFFQIGNALQMFKKMEEKGYTLDTEANYIFGLWYFSKKEDLSIKHKYKIIPLNYAFGDSFSVRSKRRERVKNEAKEAGWTFVHGSSDCLVFKAPDGSGASDDFDIYQEGSDEVNQLIKRQKNAGLVALAAMIMPMINSVWQHGLFYRDCIEFCNVMFYLSLLFTVLFSFFLASALHSYFCMAPKIRANFKEEKQPYIISKLSQFIQWVGMIVAVQFLLFILVLTVVDYSDSLIKAVSTPLLYLLSEYISIPVRRLFLSKYKGDDRRMYFLSIYFVLSLAIVLLGSKAVMYLAGI